MCFWIISSLQHQCYCTADNVYFAWKQSNKKQVIRLVGGMAMAMNWCKAICSHLPSWWYLLLYFVNFLFVWRPPVIIGKHCLVQPQFMVKLILIHSSHSTDSFSHEHCQWSITRCHWSPAEDVPMPCLLSPVWCWCWCEDAGGCSCCPLRLLRWAQPLHWASTSSMANTHPYPGQARTKLYAEK